MALDRITVSDIPLNAIIGVLPEERKKAQELVLRVDLDLDLTPSATSGDLARSIDYSRLGPELGFILAAARFRLLETAALALCHYLLAPPIAGGFAPNAATVAISKPMALGGHGFPRVAMTRSAAQIKTQRSSIGTTRCDQIFTCPDAAIFRLHPWNDQLKFPATPGYGKPEDLAIGPEAVLRIARSLVR